MYDALHRNGLLTRWWAAEATSFTARRRVSGWAATEPALAGARDYAELAVLSEQSSARGNEIGAALLRLAADDDAAELLLLWLAEPLIGKLAWSALGYRNDRWTVEGCGTWDAPDSIAERAFELACRWVIHRAGSDVAYPFAAMRDAVRDGLRAAANARWRELACQRGHVDVAARRPGVSAVAELAAVLTDAIERAVLRPDHAALIWETRALGSPIAEIAARLAEPVATVQKRKRRAERTLIASI